MLTKHCCRLLETNASSQGESFICHSVLTPWTFQLFTINAADPMIHWDQCFHQEARLSDLELTLTTNHTFRIRLKLVMHQVKIISTTGSARLIAEPELPTLAVNITEVWLALSVTNLVSIHTACTGHRVRHLMYSQLQKQQDCRINSLLAQILAATHRTLAPYVRLKTGIRHPPSLQWPEISITLSD